MADFSSPTAKWKMFKRQDSVGKLSLVAGLVQKLRAAYVKHQRPGTTSNENDSSSLLEKIGHQLSHPFVPQHIYNAPEDEIQHWEFVSALCEIGSAADSTQMADELEEMFDHDSTQYQLVASKCGLDDPFLKSYALVVFPKIRRMFLVIRGSSQVDDWLAALPSHPFESPTHAAPPLLNAAQRLANDSQVTEQIASHGYDVITVLGHSLGGATALIVSQLLKEKLKASGDVVKCRAITFGAPAFWTRGFSESVKSDVISFVHADDMMPRLTLPALNDIFEPAGRSVSPISARHEAEAERVLNSMMSPPPEDTDIATPKSSAQSALSVSDHSASSSAASSRENSVLQSNRRPPSIDEPTSSSVDSSTSSGMLLARAISNSPDHADEKREDAAAIASNDLFALPGRLLFLCKDREKPAGYAIYQLSHAEYAEVRMSPTMIEDHKMKLYMNALRALSSK